MNASILTIDSRFTLPSRGAGASQKADASHQDKPYVPVAEDQSHQTPAASTKETDNTHAHSSDAVVADKPARDFQEVLREKTRADSDTKGQDQLETKESIAVEDSVEPKEVVQAWLAENSVPVVQGQDAEAAGVEPEVAVQLGQLLGALRSQESSTVTGHAIKSDQIKVLLTTEKGQLGIKTILPEKSNGLNGLQVVLPEQAVISPVVAEQPQANGGVDKLIALNGAAIDTQALSDKTDAQTTPAAEVYADTGGKEVAANKPPQQTDASPSSDATQLPVTNTEKDLLSGAFVDKDAAGTNGEGQKVSISLAATSTQTSPAQEQPDAAPGQLRKEAPNIRADLRQRQLDPFDAGSQRSAGSGNDIANGRRFGKFGATEVLVSGGQGKAQNRPGADQGAPQNIAQMVAPNNAQVTTAPQPTAPPANPRPANLPGQNPSADVSKQILESIHGSPSQQGADRQITVRLNPPELGRVFIKLQEHEAGLTGILEVSKSQTRFEIERALPEIIRNLADSGIQVRRFDVVVSDQGRSDHETFGGQSMANNERSDHNPAGQPARDDGRGMNDEGARDSRFSVFDFRSSYYDRQSAIGNRQSAMTDGSINMLI